MADLMTLLPLDPPRAALEAFIGQCLHEAGVWRSPRTSDGIRKIDRVIERASDALRIAGSIWEIDQSVHVFWLEVVRDPAADRITSSLYYDQIETSPRRAVAAFHRVDAPEQLEWRVVLTSIATIRDDQLVLLSVGDNDSAARSARPKGTHSEPGRGTN